MLILAVLVVAFRPPLSLSVTEGRVTVLKRWDAIEIGAPPMESCVLGNGDVLTPGETLTIARRGGELESLPMGQVLGDWLKADDMWGGHSSANQMRYTNSGGGGLRGDISSLVPIGSRQALGFFNVTALGPSGMPVIAKILTLVETAPALKLTAKDHYTREPYTPECVLISYAGKNYLMDENLFQMNGDLLGPQILELPKGAFFMAAHPNGMIAIQCRGPMKTYILDLRRLRVSRVERALKLGSGSWYVSHLRAESDWILVGRALEAGRPQIAINMRTGRRRKVRSGWERVWRDLVITRDFTTNLVTVLDLKSGKSTTLPIPSK